MRIKLNTFKDKKMVSCFGDKVTVTLIRIPGGYQLVIVENKNNHSTIIGSAKTIQEELKLYSPEK